MDFILLENLNRCLVQLDYKRLKLQAMMRPHTIGSLLQIPQNSSSVTDAEEVSVGCSTGHE